jgi:predicted HTH transcriptional regulator
MDIVWQAEDSLKEKKTESDLKDLLKTLVAFANSVAPGDTATLFIGEKDDGTVQGVTNVDNIQKKVKETADKIYPVIYYKPTVYERDGKQCVRVDVKHNGLAPHFGEAAWVRRGSVTVRATEDIYQQMVELRLNKVTQLMKWHTEMMTVTWKDRAVVQLGQKVYTDSEFTATLKVVNAFWVTFRVELRQGTSDEISVPLDRLMLSWDDKEKRPKILCGVFAGTQR